MSVFLSHSHNDVTIKGEKLFRNYEGGFTVFKSHSIFLYVSKFGNNRNNFNTTIRNHINSTSTKPPAVDELENKIHSGRSLFSKLTTRVQLGSNPTQVYTGIDSKRI